jgi:ferritin-like metal-binding protein YciE
MEKSNQMGQNRTGIDMSPIHSEEMISNAESVAPSSEINGQTISAVEREYIEESEAVGSVPMPGTMKGALKSAMKKMSGRNPEMLINKLGERLAFERSGVRLYECLITKCESRKSGAGPQIPIDRLRHFRDEEQQHFEMLKNAIQSLGADPTAQTPDADISGVASMGIQKVITDPRTSIGQSLEAMLTVEMTDNAAWELLIALCEEMGLDEMADQFGQALRQEEEHLQQVRQWYEQAVLSEAGVQSRADTKH